MGILSSIFQPFELEVSSAMILNMHLEDALHSASRLGQYASYLAHGMKERE